jgi:hypothetical protein
MNGVPPSSDAETAIVDPADGGRAGRGRRRALRWAAGAAGLVVALELARGWVLPGLVAGRIVTALQAAGFPDAEIAVDSIGWRESRLGVKLSTSQGVDLAVVRYTPAGLWTGRLDGISLSGVRLTLTGGSTGIGFGERTLPNAPPGPVTAITTLPLNHMRIESAKLTIQTPLTVITATMIGQGLIADDGAVSGELGVDTALLGAPLQLAVTLGGSLLTPTVTVATLDRPVGASGGHWTGTASLRSEADGRLAGMAEFALKDGQLPDGTPLSFTSSWQGGTAGQQVAVKGKAGSSITLDLSGTLAATGARGGSLQLTADSLSRLETLLGRPSSGFDGRLRLKAELLPETGGTTVGIDVRLDRSRFPGWADDVELTTAGTLVLIEDGWRWQAKEAAVLSCRLSPDRVALAPSVLPSGSVKLTLGPVSGGTWTVVSHPQGSTLAGAVQMQADGDSISAALTADWSAERQQLQLGSITIKAASGQVRAGGGSLSIVQDPAKPVPLTAKLTLDDVRVGSPKPWLAPLTVTGEAGGSLAGSLRFSGAAQGLNGALVFDLLGDHDLISGRGAAGITLHPVTFLDGVRTPAAVFPVVGSRIDSGSGRIAARARVGWGAGAEPGNAELLLENVALTGPTFALAGVNGVLTAGSLRPLKTRGAQLLSAGLLDLGVPFTNGLLRFAVEPGEVLRVEQAGFDWAGGTVRLAPFTSPFASAGRDLKLEASGLDLAQVLATAGVEGLSATGTLAGVLPLTIDAAGPRFRKGVLAATGPGSLRYDPQQPPAFLSGAQNENTALVMQALQNMQYEELSLGIDGAVGSEMAVTLKVRGKNPDFYGGYPVALNLNLSGALGMILRNGLGSQGIPDAVRARIEEYGRTR